MSNEMLGTEQVLQEGVKDFANAIIRTADNVKSMYFHDIISGAWKTVEALKKGDMMGAMASGFILINAVKGLISSGELGAIADDYSKAISKIGKGISE